MKTVTARVVRPQRCHWVGLVPNVACVLGPNSHSGQPSVHSRASVPTLCAVPGVVPGAGEWHVLGPTCPICTVGMSVGAR